MDYLGIQAIKNAYVDKIKDTDKNKAEKIIKDSITTPVFINTSVHGEDQISVSDVNSFLTDITVDIEGLEQELSSAADNYKILLSSIKTRLSFVDDILTAEEERIMDMNTICGNYDEFTKVVSYTPQDVNGTAGVINKKIFCAKTENLSNISLTISNVDGNVYEGNNYVTLDNGTSLLKDSLQTSNRDNMIDGKETTYYEYSRINASGPKDSSEPVDIVHDSEDVQCTISLEANAQFSMLSLNCTGKLSVNNVHYALDDGYNYQPAMVKPMKLNDSEIKYNDTSMFAGTNVICFPATKYVKLSLSSSEITDDDICYEKTEAADESSTKKSIVKLSNAFRKRIRINELSIAAGKFSTGTIEINKIITAPVKSIAIFANEFTPGFVASSENLITYKLTVNGNEYDVVPLNSNKKGIKIIRFGASSLNDSYAKSINETIKSASLKITIDTPDSCTTPFLSNLKVCLGEEA